MTTPLVLGRVAEGLSGSSDIVSVKAKGSLGVDVEYELGSLANAQTVRDQLLALGERKMDIPLTWAEDSKFDGFYNVRSVSVEGVDEEFYQSNIVKASLELDPIGARQSAVVQVRTSGSYRAFGFSPSIIHAAQSAIPSSWDDWTWRTAQVSLASQLRRLTSTPLDCYITYSASGVKGIYEAHVAPASFYDAACTLTVNGSPYLGRSARVVPSDTWSLSNGLVTLSLASALDIAAGIQLQWTYRLPDGTAWGSVTNKGAIYKNVSTTPAVVVTTAPTHMWVKRNDPESTIITLVYSYDKTLGGTYAIDIALRRGWRTIYTTLYWLNGTYSPPNSLMGFGYAAGFNNTGYGVVGNGSDGAAAGWTENITNADGFRHTYYSCSGPRAVNAVGSTGITAGYNGSSLPSFSAGFGAYVTPGTYGDDALSQLRAYGTSLSEVQKVCGQ